MQAFLSMKLPLVLSRSLFGVYAGVLDGCAQVEGVGALIDSTIDSILDP